MTESSIDYNQVIYDFFKTIKNPDDLNMNIFDFFNKYPTKNTFKCPDGSIINMSPYEDPVDKNQDILPLKDGIPQGEEATRMIVKNIDSGVIISSPPGAYGTYFITRYGSPVYNHHNMLRYDDYPLKRYDELRKMLYLGNTNCYFEKFKCDSEITKKCVAADFDLHIYACDKHRKSILGMININVATIADIKLFLTDDLIIKYTFHNNNIKKCNLLKKIKITLNLAESGKLLNNQLDSTFKLVGIHYYPYYVNNEEKSLSLTNGWALTYTDYNYKIAHIYLNELSSDIEVIKSLELFAYEIITAKHRNDLDVIQTFFRLPKKPQFTLLEKIFVKPYTLDIKHIVQNNMIH
jgi:hypothetical protein